MRKQFNLLIAFVLFILCVSAVISAFVHPNGVILHHGGPQRLYGGLKRDHGGSHTPVMVV